MSQLSKKNAIFIIVTLAISTFYLTVTVWRQREEVGVRGKRHATKEPSVDVFSQIQKVVKPSAAHLTKNKLINPSFSSNFDRRLIGICKCER